MDGMDRRDLELHSERIACCTQAILYGVRWMPCQSIAMRSKGLSSSASGCTHDRSALLLRTLFEHLSVGARLSLGEAQR